MRTGVNMTQLTIRFAEVEVGTELPELVIPVTTTMVVGGAIASRDFTPVHHDKAAAQATGLPDIIMNTMTTNCFVSRFVTDWTGPDAIIKSISLKLGAPNHPGDTMRMTGKVTAKDEAAGTVRIEITGANSWGDHVTAKVEVALPRGA
jgi:acyl dehydratase